ncbi:uncharacterized protein RAG0_03506 [Rhynchosporium agropyri]|uniref:Uncharacterized protein n=1 Tax=Rhynchosporium agropyri TaxID=914238 RepID=A0A1E1K4K9_9HELO|nr:uncharacterized protein RAG0_03506 [Rhynchosporium agropyri]
MSNKILATVSISSLPVEVAVSIFEQCDEFQEVVALASTCKGLHSVWRLSSSSIIWKVGRGIRCFDLALIAVRATAIVLKASQAGLPSPPFASMHTLSGVVQKPTIAELKEVLNMQHLVRCIEHMYFFSEVECDTLFGGPMIPSSSRLESSDREDEEKNERFRIRFYTAIYQLFFAGAALSRPYMAPFWEAKEKSRTSFFGRCRVPVYNHLGNGVSASLTTDDRGFLRPFPVYNHDVEDYTTIGKWREKEYENIFGPFASWLVKEGSAFQDPMPRSRHHETESLMCLLVGYEHLICKFTNLNGIHAFGRYADSRICPAALEGKTRTATIIVFGVFRVEEVIMPSNIEGTKDGLLPVSIHPTLKGTDQEAFDIPSIMEHLDYHSQGSAPDDFHEHPNPPAMFQLWFFALRRYLDLGFSHNAFWQWSECMWWQDVGGGTVFHDPSWAPVQPYKAGKVSWRDEDSDLESG